MSEKPRSVSRILAIVSIAVVVVVSVLAKFQPIATAKSRVVGFVGIGLYVVGFILAVAALWLEVRKRGAKGVLSLGLVGLLINGIILVLLATMMPALMRVKAHLSSPYTVEELQSMSPVHEGRAVFISQELGFRFEVPPGFERFDDPTPKQLPVICSFMHVTDGGAVYVIGINRLPGMINPGSFDDIEGVKQSLPPNAIVTHTTEKWWLYELDVFTSTFTVKGETFTVATVQVPLVTNAVQISVVGPPTDEETILSLLREVLMTFMGRCSWDYDRLFG